ncbi:fungal-specific transcription factor domain-containing protein [Lentinula aciculospora]|uniref:Fungal-specific transcription factor domain-containing protein n=1 Tax=Lentinula aciculospora TaxID=153920 RepID=A0A9W9AFZ2_9AGAR|nr:fungal-specific transcription factor domain-containing protein [Lentinula aciculospora]
MSDSPGLAPAAKRRRTPACDNCHRRKVKCDRDEKANNICSVCSSSGIDCTRSIQKKKRGPKAKILPGKSDPRTLVTTILSAPKTVIIPSDESIIRQMLFDLASYARNLERQLEQALEQGTQSESESLLPASQSSPLLPLSGAQDEAEAHDILLLQVQRLSIDDNDDKLYHSHAGRSSHYMLLQTALTIREEADAGYKGIISVESKRNKLWMRAPWHRLPPEPVDPPYEFPESDLLRKLLTLYFDKHHPIYPLLHRPSFEHQVYVQNLHLTDRRFGAIVLAVCALGSRLTDDPRTLYDGSQDLRSAGWKYFGQIRLVRTSFTVAEPLSLYDVQLYALSILHVSTTPIGDVAWFLLALGIRSAQLVGAYRKANFKTPMKSRLEEELWRRAFWNLTATDLYMSIAMGHPRATREEDIDLELPPECDDEYWDIPSNPELELIQPIGKASNMSYWHHFIKLLHIAGLVKDNLYTTRKSAPWGGSLPDSNDKIVMELDSALNSWIYELPDHLKWDPHRTDNVLFSQTVCLHSNYYWVQIQLHRLFIRPGPLSAGNFPSLAICTNAARSYIHILQAYDARPEMPVIAAYIAPVFMAAIMLLINLWTSLRQKTSYDPRKDMADVYTCVNHLHAYEERFEIAGRLHDILEAIISVSQIPQSPQKESLKRSRNLHPSQQDSGTQDKCTRQIAGTQRATGALHPAPTFQAGDMTGMNTNIEAPGLMSNPFLGLDIASPEQQISTVNSSSWFPFDPSAPPSFGTGLDDIDFTASLASAWGDTNQEDWTSFMSKVDDLLHAVNRDSL